MQQRKQNGKKQTKRTLIIVLIVFVFIALIAGVFFFTPLKDTFLSNLPQKSSSISTGTVDYSGPTESDIKESQNAKKKADEKDTDSSSSTPSGKKSVPVAVSYADIYNDNLEVRAFISGIIEGTGTCTVTATKGSISVTESTSAFIDASTTQCNPIYITKSRLSPGTWSVVTAFSSPDAEGTSEAVEVTVQ